MSKRWKYLILVGAQGAEYVNHQVNAVARLPNSHPMEYGFVESALNVIGVKRWPPAVGRDRQHRGKGERMMEQPTMESLGQRLDRVERENRRLKVAGVVVLASWYKR